MRKYIRTILLWANILFALMLLGSYAANKLHPQQYWFIAFFGLLYPITLFVNTGFIVFWLWRKKWFFLISFVVIIAGFSNVNRVIQLRIFGKTDRFHQSVKLLSYNVRLFNLYKWEKGESVSDSILHFINRQNAGILCFQEFLTTTGTSNITEKHIDTTLKSFPYKHVSYTYKPSANFNYGLATYSKYPIVRVNKIRFSNSFNSCIMSDLKIGTDTIRVFNVHLQSIRLKKSNFLTSDTATVKLDSKHFNDVRIFSGQMKAGYLIRSQQVDELSWHIRRSPYPVIICGDFNDTPVSYTYSKIRGKLSDAFMGSGEGTGSTYRGLIPSIRIDYIFHSPNIKSFNYKTHRVNLSDHFPISCELFILR